MAEMETQTQSNAAMKRALLLLNILLLSIGNCGGPLVMRLYFLHGGKRVWLSSWLQTAAWPVIIIPITIAYLHRHRPTLIIHQVLLNETAFVHRLSRGRNPHRIGRLHLRLRHGTTPHVDFGFDHCVPVGFHGRFCFFW
ncbi:hypothetical protein Ddye_006374 [Dipteronia dyeriana]|uniref:Uncharacterized protein n=1 Tax=Dipteronia dyeriana TaxID=168575 RepID=A0AAD9XIG3_9ROSI|nr:hypothetical protein Ddye_006374 [Dipteronia dyeriana]